MFCEKCGAVNEEDSRFCENCGFDLQISVQNEQKFAAPNYYTGSQPVATKISPQQQVNYYEQQIPNNSSYPYPQAQKKPYKLSKKVKLIIAASTAFVILCTSFFAYGSASNDPKNLVKDYFLGMNSQNWEKTYDCIDIVKGEFTTKDLFVKMMKKQFENSPKQEILNYSVKENNVAKQVTDYYNQYAQFAGNSSSQTQSELEKTLGLIKSYTIIYTLKGSSSSQTVNINLIKQKGKSWLFYDNYKVTANDLVTQSYTVYAPKGAKLLLDDKEIGSQYIVQNSSESSNNSNTNYDTYKLTNVFLGQHIIKISTLYAKEYEKQITITNGSSSQFDNLELTEESLNEVFIKAEAITKLAYSSAIEGKDFESIKSNFTKNESKLLSAKQAYQNFAANIKKTDGTGLKSIKFSGFSPKKDNKKTSSDFTYEANFSLQYTYVKLSRGWFSDTITEETIDTPRSESFTINFVYEDGKWVVGALENISIYY